MLLETSLGDLVIDLETEACPKTCQNFLKLCKVYYYNLNAFFNGELLDVPASWVLTCRQCPKTFWRKPEILQLREREASLSGL